MRPTEYIAPVLAVLLALTVGWMAITRVHPDGRKAPAAAPAPPADYRRALQQGR